MKVLDNGSITLIDVMGSDGAIASSARVSHGQFLRVTSEEEDAKLIDTLISKGHLTPFEMAQMTFYVKLPIFVARQWVRHRTASLVEKSGRYTLLAESYMPSAERIKVAAKDADPGEIHDIIAEAYRACNDAYERLLNRGVKRELARIVLPVAKYTEWIWTTDLRNLLHFLHLRLDKHAQWEIRQYARKIAGMVEDHFPLTWKAFTKHVLEADDGLRYQI